MKKYTYKFLGLHFWGYSDLKHVSGKASAAGISAFVGRKQVFCPTYYMNYPTAAS
jgi:hypothetical protein